MVIFDLDQTLVDSRIAESMRQSRKWSKVYELIPQFSVYENISTLLEGLNDNDIATAIVTSSPASYGSRVVNYWSLGIRNLVAYHDTARRKPYPDPIFLAMERANVEPQQTFHIGDLASDTIAAKNAGVVSIGALWGTADPDKLIDSNPDFCFETVLELHQFLADQLFL